MVGVGGKIIGAKRHRLLETDGDDSGGFMGSSEKKLRAIDKHDRESSIDYFDAMPDELVILVLIQFVSMVVCPSKIVDILVTCKRLKELIFDPLVLARITAECLWIKPHNWLDSTSGFLKQCADSGNLEACYILGMIQFYCLQNRKTGISLLNKAAVGLHTEAMYSLAVIAFSRSLFSSLQEKMLGAGVVLCSKAARLEHLDALRELGLCIKDGYGVDKKESAGKRILLCANYLEVASSVTDDDDPSSVVDLSLLYSDFGCDTPIQEPQPLNLFFSHWFMDKLEDGLRLCAYDGCRRAEIRKSEFRQCSICQDHRYCSRVCQARHWKLGHKDECRPRMIFQDTQVDPPSFGGG